jgi:hypothetical protein
MNNRIDMRFIIAGALVVLCVASRLLPLSPNFTPIMAVALFSGMMFANKKVAMLIPLASMFITDLVLGLHSTMISVYASFAIIALLGMRIHKANALNVVGNSILGALIFFVVTNFAVWAAGWYSYTFAGLATCYEMAIPFFRATLASSVLYSVVLFGGFYLIERFALKPVPTNAIN